MPVRSIRGSSPRSAASSISKREIRAKGLPTDTEALRHLKSMGFSDARLAKLTGLSIEDVATRRHQLGVRPIYKRIDTCAAEFASPTAYMYSSYQAPFAGTPANEAAPSDREKIVILGGGPNRIGQGIEFDYCCCHASFALKEAGYETIMVNCNPETVSTDYDTSDRLYFEPLTAEDVIEIIDIERSKGTLHGVIVQFGGQTPLKLAEALGARQRADPGHLAGCDRPRRGSRPLQAADRDARAAPAEKRHRDEPGAGAGDRRARSATPVLIRPSYVLGGRGDGNRQRQRATRPLCGAACRRRSTGRRISSSRIERPLLIDRYLSDAIEVDVDCIADGKDTFIAGIMEHIEEAGIHSGDSACALPPASLDAKIHCRTRPADPRARARPQGRRPDERAVRHQGRRHLCPRGEPARLAHGAVRRQGDRHAGRQDRSAGHGRRNRWRASVSSRSRSSPGNPSISRSRKRCSRLPASPASTRCSGRK